jgi:hypothetical protein
VGRIGLSRPPMRIWNRRFWNRRCSFCLPTKFGFEHQTKVKDYSERKHRILLQFQEARSIFV